MTDDERREALWESVDVVAALVALFGGAALIVWLFDLWF